MARHARRARRRVAKAGRKRSVRYAVIFWRVAPSTTIWIQNTCTLSCTFWRPSNLTASRRSGVGVTVCVLCRLCLRSREPPDCPGTESHQQQKKYTKNVLRTYFISVLSKLLEKSRNTKVVTVTPSRESPFRHHKNRSHYACRLFNLGMCCAPFACTSGQQPNSQFTRTAAQYYWSLCCQLAIPALAPWYWRLCYRPGALGCPSPPPRPGPRAVGFHVGKQGASLLFARYLKFPADRARSEPAPTAENGS